MLAASQPHQLGRLAMRVELDSHTNTITVGGVKISLLFLKRIADPDPNKYYRLVREGDVVTVTEFRQ